MNQNLFETTPYTGYGNPYGYQQIPISPVAVPLSTPRETTPPPMNGKVVASPEDIRPNDIPMDGSVSFFPLKDGTTIYAKQWTGNGTIATAVYKLDVPPQEPKQPTAEEQILTRLERIEQMLCGKQPAPKEETHDPTE